MPGREYRILLVEDEESIAAGVELVLADRYSLTLARTLAEARHRLSEQRPDLLLLDIRLPDGAGTDLLRSLREKGDPLECVVITAVREVATVVQVMKLGVLNLLEKPFAREDLILCIERAYETWKLKAEVSRLRSELFEPCHWDRIVAHSAGMKNVIALARRVAMGDSNVLITGESGTGKELVARALHFGSPRKDGPFVAVNCAQFAPSLLESELFGHEKGAFTGATQQRRGRFELADGGTLFLDEVGNTGSEMQARILRVLETGTFERVGGEEPIQSDFRLLAATNTDLDKEVQEGRFRKDLYYRLHVVPIHIPPLRERREDILPLCEHAISLFRARTGRSVKGITPEAQELLVNWDWPGNVRELCNAIEMALTLEDGEWITSMHLPVRMQVAARVGRKTDGPRSTLEALMEDFEKQLLAQTLRVHGWSHVDAARSLGIHRNTIENKIKRYGIMPDGAGLDAG